MHKLSLHALVFLPFTALLACATAQPIVGPDGTQDQLVTCPAVNMCYDKARDVCSGNYSIVNTTAEASGPNGAMETKMLVKCSGTGK